MEAEMTPNLRCLKPPVLCPRAGRHLTAQGFALGWPNGPYRAEDRVFRPVGPVRSAQGEALGRLGRAGFLQCTPHPLRLQTELPSRLKRTSHPATTTQEPLSQVTPESRPRPFIGSSRTASVNCVSRADTVIPLPASPLRKRMPMQKVALVTGSGTGVGPGVCRPVRQARLRRRRQLLEVRGRRPRDGRPRSRPLRRPALLSPGDASRDDAQVRADGGLRRGRPSAGSTCS